MEHHINKIHERVSKLVYNDTPNLSIRSVVSKRKINELMNDIFQFVKTL